MSIPDATPAQIDAVLAFLPIFEQPGFSAGQWAGGSNQMPYFAYRPEVNEFVSTLYAQEFIVVFDWTAWQEEANHFRLDPAALVQADLLTVCKLLTTHIRADRFVEGHLAQIIESGHLAAILRRLKQLRGKMSRSQKLRGPKKQPSRPHPNCYWVIPGQLMAGEYPGSYDNAEAQQKVGRLLDAGVNFFVDLTRPNELKPYHQYLPALCEQRGLFAEHHRLPIEDMAVPSRDHMATILDTIDAAIEAGKTVYVHCWGGIGRTGTVIGCYLVRHGNSGNEALKELARLWKNVEKRRAYPHSPQTTEQMEFVRHWAGQIGAARYN